MAADEAAQLVRAAQLLRDCGFSVDEDNPALQAAVKAVAAQNARHASIAEAATAVRDQWEAMGRVYINDAESNRLGDLLDALARAVEAAGQAPGEEGERDDT